MKLRIEEANGEFFLDYWIPDGNDANGKPKGCWKNHSVWATYDEALREKAGLFATAMEISTVKDSLTDGTTEDSSGVGA